MEQTKIEWCDSTVNPTENCDGCELWNTATGVHKCYAGKMTERWKGKGAFDQPVVLKPGRMAATLKWKDLTGTDRPSKPWLNGMPRIIFVGDMADLFSKGVPFEYIEKEVIETAFNSPHNYMLLTKQSQRMLDFVEWHLAQDPPSGWPSNVWLGVSVTNQATTSRMDYLRICAQLIGFSSINKPKYFVSYEPALTYVDFRHKFAVDLIIIGGESGVSEPTLLDTMTVWDVINLCKEYKIAPFVKQMGTRWAVQKRSDSYKGGKMEDWPADIRVREMPK